MSHAVTAHALRRLLSIRGAVIDARWLLAYQASAAHSIASETVVNVRVENAFIPTCLSISLGLDLDDSGEEAPLNLIATPCRP